MFKTKAMALLAGACMVAVALPSPGLAKKRQSPAVATISPQEQAVRSVYAGSVADGVASFYAYRQYNPFWLSSAGAVTPAATQLITILKRAQLDGMADGPSVAAQAEAAIAAAQGDPVRIATAERIMSSAWVRYVQGLQGPAAGVEYAVPHLAPRPFRADYVLFDAARAPSLTDHLTKVSNVNPMYSRLRDAVWQQVQAGALTPDRRIQASLERTRILPATGRFVMVDAASARLFMVEDGQVKDSMKVVVGKLDPALQTPMIVSLISYATFNPYWHVPPHLVPNIAKGVVAAGVGALKPKRYQVVNGYIANPLVINPSEVNWKAVAAGTEKIALRQLPGPENSMGALKFQFPNVTDIYLHDTPMRQYFKEAQRTLSNGCIRLEDAKRLGRWLLGREPTPPSAEPEQHVQLPQGVPVYVTYLTAQMQGEKLTLLPDVYGKDAAGAGRIATLK